MKKSYMLVLLGLAAYVAAILIYFLHQPIDPIPASYQGSAADPATFMSIRQLHRIHDYSTIEYLGFFLDTPLQWTILFLVLAFSLSARFREWAEKAFHRSLPRAALFVTVLSLFISVVHFPVDFYFFHLSHQYGISVQPLSAWLIDQLKSFAVNLVMMTAAVWLLFWAVRRSPRRWWLWFWLMTVPLTVFLMYIQPVVLDPIFHHFQPLANQQLKAQILQLAHKAGIPTDQVYQVNMSTQTNGVNAYVNGIGNNMRIVLWDTTLHKLNTKEILFVMAHEMGHYVRRHMYWSLLVQIIENFVLSFLVFKLSAWMIDKWGGKWHIRRIQDIASLPLLMLLLSFLTFAISPLNNAMSRQMEQSADQYAITMRGPTQVQAGVTAFQKIAEISLSEVNPPFLAQFFLGSHPTLMKRIHYLESFKQAEATKGAAK